MKKFLSLIAILLLTIVLVAGIANIAIAVAGNEKNEYAVPRQGYMYYQFQDIPGLFEIYLGYTPDVIFNESKAEATAHLKGGYTITIPLKQFAPDFWGLEAPADKIESLFSQWQVYNYPCFQYQTERKYFRDGGKGIYYDFPTVQEIFLELTGAKYDLGFRHLGTTEFLISCRYDIDKTISYEIKERGQEFEFADDGDFLLNARIVSQIIYDWERANADYREIHLGSIL